MQMLAFVHLLLRTMHPVRLPVEIMRMEAVSLLYQAVPVQQLLVCLVLVPHWRCSGRHAIAIAGPKLPPVRPQVYTAVTTVSRQLAV